MVLGSGPIVIGQACEFDYSGTQACKALRAEGYQVALVNSNPATIMTDPEFADRTYIEPLTPASVLAVLERERPDVLLPTLGGQTGLNVSVALAESGDLDRLGIEMVGASLSAIHKAEDRSGFQRTMLEAGLEVPRAGIARSTDEALAIGEDLGYPVIVRPSFTLGGGGGGFASDGPALASLAARALDVSPVGEILVEESIAGWKEFELEVMRDHADNAVVICSIENVDPMGVHTGDSITVAPAQTLTDREYQAMRDAALRCIRAIGVETGGSNVQFAVNPRRRPHGRDRDEPAGVAVLGARVEGHGVPDREDRGAAGRRLPPRRDRERHHGRDAGRLRTHPRLRRREDPAVRVREVPRGRPGPHVDDEVGRRGDGDRPHVQGGAGQGVARPREGRVRPRARPATPAPTSSRASPCRANAGCIWSRRRSPPDTRSRPSRRPRASIRGSWTRSRRWWSCPPPSCGRGLSSLGADELRELKRFGLSDARLAASVGAAESEVRRRREELGVRPVFKTVDTCGGEFPARTPYHYSTYEEEDEVRAGRPARAS